MTRLYIFDLDGTLTPQRPTSVAPFERRFLEGVEATCRRLREADAHLAIASNQGGILRGLDIVAIDEHFRWVCDALGVGTYRYAWEETRRKPGPAMLLELMAHLGVSPGLTCMVGDADTDRLAAEAAGVAFFHRDSFFAM